MAYEKKREKLIQFRASETEEEALLKLAELYGMKSSELLRALLRKAAEQAGILPKLATEKTDDPALIAA